MSERIEHVVLYSFSYPEALPAAVDYMKTLQTRALRDGKPYIENIVCGTTRPSSPVRSLGMS